MSNKDSDKDNKPTENPAEESPLELEGEATSQESGSDDVDMVVEDQELTMDMDAGAEDIEEEMEENEHDIEDEDAFDDVDEDYGDYEDQDYDESDEDFSNIDDDFDEDDALYAAPESKNKMYTIIGVTCFVLAGIIGIWQFWMSGADQYNAQNQEPGMMPVMDAGNDLMAQPMNNDLPVTPVTSTVTDVDADSAVNAMAPEVVMDENGNPIPLDQAEEIPDLSVEMSDEEISDEEMDTMAELSDDMDTMGETGLEDMGADPALSMEDMGAEMIDTADADIAEDAMIDGAEDAISSVSEDVSETANAVASDTEASAEDILSGIDQEIDEAIVENMVEEKVDEKMAAMQAGAVEFMPDIETSEDVDAQAKTMVAPPKAEVSGITDLPDAATTDSETLTDKLKGNPEPIMADDDAMIEPVKDQAAALPQPKMDQLKPVMDVENVEPSPVVTALPEEIVPDRVDYGSLTPAQILERAVVVRPQPKKLRVVTKTNSSTSNRSILVAADRSLKQGSYADALNLYNDVLGSSPRDTSALMGKALTLQKLNRSQDAINAYQAVLDIDPNNLNAMTNYLGLLQGADTMSSISRLKDMKAKNPRSAAIAGTLGMLYGQIKDVSNAASYFDKAQSLDPNNAVYPYNLAILADRMGSRGKALEHYQKALQLVLRYGGQGVVSEQVVSRRISQLNAVQQ